jgi:hypothetical protein
VCFVSMNFGKLWGREGIYRVEDSSSGTDDIEASEFFKRSIEGGLELLPIGYVCLLEYNSSCL